MLIIDGRANQMEDSLTSCTLTASRLSQQQLGSPPGTGLMQQLQSSQPSSFADI